MRNVKAKILRRTAESIGMAVNVAHVEKQHKPKRFTVEELNEQGQLVKVEKAYIPLPTIRLDENCTRAVYQDLKCLS